MKKFKSYQDPFPLGKTEIQLFGSVVSQVFLQMGKEPIHILLRTKVLQSKYRFYSDFK